MPSPPNDCGQRVSAALDFDPDNLLDRDAHVLFDPRLLAPLLRQLCEELGAARAAVAVAQIGALHGLRDAACALQRTRSVRSPQLEPFPMPIRMHCQPGSGGELRGHWPDRSEATARRVAQAPLPAGGCQLSAGYTTGWLSGLAATDLYALEAHCAGDGQSHCHFVARNAEAWMQHGSQSEQARIEALRLPLLKQHVRERQPLLSVRGSDAEDGDAVDRDTGAIHIWGPVMVIPYAGPDEALGALDLIGRDPAAREVSVVVLDLEGAILDEAHGALSLEHIVHSIEAWGAEAIFTEVSPLSASVVSGLEHPPLLVLKDLDAAIAAAFQVADSQRMPL